jgi:hypothetical protein
VEAAVVVAVVVAAAAEPWDPFGTLGAALWIGARRSASHWKAQIQKTGG